MHDSHKTTADYCQNCLYRILMEEEEQAFMIYLWAQTIPEERIKSFFIPQEKNSISFKKVIVERTVFWDMMLCSQVDGYQSFRKHCL